MIKIPDIEIDGPIMMAKDALCEKILVWVWGQLMEQKDEEGCGPVFAYLFYGNGEKS